MWARSRWCHSAPGSSRSRASRASPISSDHAWRRRGAASVRGMSLSLPLFRGDGGQYVEVRRPPAGADGRTDTSDGGEHHDHGQAPDGELEHFDPLVAQGGDERPPEEDADNQSEDRALHGNDDRLPPDRGPQLLPRHPDSPEESELTSSLEDRQGEGVADAHQGDDDSQGEQCVYAA